MATKACLHKVVVSSQIFPVPRIYPYRGWRPPSLIEETLHLPDLAGERDIGPRGWHVLRAHGTTGLLEEGADVRPGLVRY